MYTGVILILWFPEQFNGYVFGVRSGLEINHRIISKFYSICNCEFCLD